METKLNGNTLKILPDDNPIHPRTDCDHLGTLLAWHRRYSLGDNNDYSQPDDFWQSDEAKNIYASLPVYMLDHSSINLSCNDFHDPWDSGRLGLIYCTEAQAKAWLGDDCTPDKAKVELNREIENYDTYLNSEHYCFKIEGQNGETLDSCGSFQRTGAISELLKQMKEFVSDEHFPLFDKLAAQIDKHACM